MANKGRRTWNTSQSQGIFLAKCKAVGESHNMQNKQINKKHKGKKNNT